MAFQTEVFEGQFNITQEGVDALTAALEKLQGVADKVTGSLSKITFKLPKIDTSQATKAAEAVADAADKASKKVKGPDQQAIDEAIKKIDILLDKARVANDNVGQGLSNVAAGIKGVAASEGNFTKIIDSLAQVKRGADVVGQSMTNVRAGIELATRDGGNLFLGVRQAVFGVSNSSNILARTLDLVGNNFIKTSASSDHLVQSAQSITQQFGQFNNNLSLATIALKEIGKQEGVNLSALNKLDQQVQDVGKQYIRLNDVIKAGGKVTPGQLSQVQNKSEQLLETVNSLIESGFVKMDTQAGKTLLAMRDKFQDNVTGSRILAAQVQVLNKEIENTGKSTEKSGSKISQVSQTSKSAFEKVEQATEKSGSKISQVSQTSKSAFEKVKQAIGGLFSSLPPQVDKAKSSVVGFNQELQRTSFISNLVSETLGTVFGNVIFSALNKATGAVQAFFGLFTKSFVENNNLVQNFDLTLRQMLTGLDAGKIDSALANVTTFIREAVAKTPFELADAFQSFQRLATAGLDPKKWLTPVADAAAAVNKPMEQLIGAMQRLQVGAKGIGIDMLRDFGIPVNQVGAFIDKTTGKTLTLDQVFKENGDITKLNAQELAAMGVEFRKLEFDKQGALINDTSDAMNLLNGFLTQNTTFAGAAEARSRTFTGVLSNLKDVISIVGIEAGKPIFASLTAAGTGLLNFIGVLQPSLERLANTIGTGISNALNFAAGSFGSFAGSAESIVIVIDNINAFLEAAFAGDWASIWAGMADIADSAINSVFDSLNAFVTDAFDWGISFVSEIANGIIEGASSLLTEAVNYVGELIGSFLAPGSPPEEGPLREIDTWGSSLMEVFTDSMAKVDTSGIERSLGSIKNVFDKFDITSAHTDVLAIQEQIAKAEAEGFVPAYLKKQLQLAKDKVTLLEQQKQLEKEVAESREKEQKAAEGVATKGDDRKKSSGGGADRAATSERAGRQQAEKKTAQQIRDDALAILDQQLKDGVIKYEDYAKERLKIEQKFYEGTLEEGGKVSAQNIADIKKYQEEVEKIVDARKSVAGEAPLIEIPTARDVLEGFASDTASLGEQASTALVKGFGEGINKNFGQVKANLLNLLTGLKNQIVTGFTDLFTPKPVPLVAFTGGDREATALDSIISKFNEFKTFIETNMPFIQAAVLTAFEVIKSSAIVAFDLISSIFNTTLKPAIDDLTVTIGKFGLDWGDVLNAVIASVTGFVVIVSAAILGVIGVVTALINAILLGAARFLEGVSKIITGIQQVFSGNIIAGLLNIMIGLFDVSIGTMLDLISGFVTSVVSFFTNLYNELVGESIIPDLVEAVIFFFTDMASRVIEPMIAFVDNIIVTVEERINEIIELGEGIIEGLVQGIEANKDKVLEVLKSIIDSAIDEVRSFLGIQSPSTVFAEIGGLSMEGFVEGFMSAFPSFSDALGLARDEIEDFGETFINDRGVAHFLTMLRRIEGPLAGIIDTLNVKTHEGFQQVIDLLVGVGFEGQNFGINQEELEALIANSVLQIRQAQTTLQDQFVETQAAAIQNVQESLPDILQGFNEQFFNISSGATEARIELERLFNRTVTDEEVERMAQAFEGVPVDQLTEQQRLIRRNFLLQQQLAEATEEQAVAQESIAQLGATFDIFEQLGLGPEPEVTQQAEDVGTSIGEALGLGIDASISEVLASINAATQAMIQQLMANLGIQSPSTIAFGFGEQFTMGFAGGILARLGDVQGAVGALEGIVDPATGLAISNGISNLGDTGSAAMSGGAPVQLIQYNTVNDEFDMAVFTSRTQEAMVQILRTNR